MCVLERDDRLIGPSVGVFGRVHVGSSRSQPTGRRTSRLHHDNVNYHHRCANNYHHNHVTSNHVNDNSRDYNSCNHNRSVGTGPTTIDGGHIVDNNARTRQRLAPIR